MNHTGTVVIETERLLLRPFTLKDADAMFRNWASDQEVTKFLRWPHHKDISVTRKLLKELGEPIGSISVVGMNERVSTVHIGYCIGRPWWRQGITSEAFAAIIPFLFEEVGVNRIEAQHDPNNPNSGKVMLKCGLKYEGTLRQADFSNRGIVDAAMYSLMASEYFANKANE